MLRLGSLKSFAVSAIDKNRGTSGTISRLDVAPTVPHQEAFFEIEIKTFCRAHDHPRFGFSAIAGILVIVATDLDGIERELILQNPVHGFDDRPLDFSTADIGLIGDDDKPIISLAQVRQRLPD